MTYWVWVDEAQRFPERLIPKGPFREPQPLHTWRFADTSHMDTTRKWVDRQIRIELALREISLIQVVAQHPWAWDLIGITRWAQQRRSNS